LRMTAWSPSSVYVGGFFLTFKNSDRFDNPCGISCTLLQRLSLRAPELQICRCLFKFHTMCDGSAAGGLKRRSAGNGGQKEKLLQVMLNVCSTHALKMREIHIKISQFEKHDNLHGYMFRIYG